MSSGRNGAGRTTSCPYIEQDNVHKINDQPVARRTTIKTYFCPPAGADGLRQRGQGRLRRQQRQRHRHRNVTGVVQRMGLERVRFADITDGASNTAMVGEKRMKLDRFNLT